MMNGHAIVFRRDFSWLDSPESLAITTAFSLSVSVQLDDSESFRPSGVTTAFPALNNVWKC